MSTLAPLACPECGAPMDVDRCCLITEPSLYRRADGERYQLQRLAAAGLCSRCECCIELTREQLRSN